MTDFGIFFTGKLAKLGLKNLIFGKDKRVYFKEYTPMTLVIKLLYAAKNRGGEIGLESNFSYYGVKHY